MIERLLIVYAFSIPLVVLPLGETKIVATDLLFLPSVCAIFFAGGVPRRTAVLLLTVILLLAVFTLSLVANIQSLPNARESYLKVLRVTSLWLPLILALRISQHSVDRVRDCCTTWFVVGGFLSALMCIALHQFGIILDANQQVDWQQTQQTGVRIYRAGGLTGGSGSTGAMIALWALVGFGTACRSYGIRRYLVAATIALTTVVIVVIASSRGGALNLVFGGTASAVILILRGSQRLIFTLLGAISLVPCVFSVDMMLDGPLSQWAVQFVVRGSQYSASLNDLSSGRLENWSQSIPYIKENLLFGVGLKNGVNFTENLIDNSYLMLLLECGIFGLLLYLSIFFQLFSTLMSNILRSRDPNPVFVLGALIGIATHGLLCEIYTFWASFPAFLLIAGLWCRVPPEVVFASDATGNVNMHHDQEET